MTRTYRHLPSLNVARDDFSIRCIDDADIEPVRQWRNAQMDVLRQSTKIEREEQVAYFARAIWPDMAKTEPRNILLAIERGGRLIGYGGLVHCDWADRQAEISVLFDTLITRNAVEYRVSLLAFLDMIGEIGFAQLDLHRLTLETYAVRTAHIAILEQAGFYCEGRLRDHVRINGRAVDSLIHARLATD